MKAYSEDLRQRVLADVDTGLLTQAGGGKVSPQQVVGAAADLQGAWRTTTLVAALRYGGLPAPLVLDGPLDGAAFRAYVAQHLAPTLRPGDVGVLDYLACHKVAGVREALEAVRARMVYLPPDSPDLNPIEQVFAKFKHLLRSAVQRTLPAL